MSKSELKVKLKVIVLFPQKQSPPNGSLNWKDNAFSKLLTMYCLSQPFIGVLDSHLNIFVEA